ncbi:polysaccharide deacetylase family protein [bacterium]|nr:polysaccharide deacetylase family protein [bacterium]
MKCLIQRLSLLMLLCAAASLLSSATRSLNQGYLVPSGNTRIDQQVLKGEHKFCALTFDDGPDVRYTMKVHDILREEGIRATFFVVGRNVDRYPEQVVALAEYGHEIGNHSYTHRDLLTLSKAQIKKEIDDTSSILEKLGITPHWFRPPYGSFNRTVVDQIADAGLDTMLWSVDPNDWQRPGSDVIRKRVVGNAGPGAVILMHSTVSQTVEALPGIIKDLRAEGYTFVTASEWQQLVSGGATLETLNPVNDYSMPLNLMDAPVAGMDMPSGTISGGIPADADVWQRVPAGTRGNAARVLKVYANFVDDNDLRRVLSDGKSRNMIASESVVGNGLLRVLDGLPPQQIVAVVEEPGDRRDARDSVEVQIIDTPVIENGELIAEAARQAKDLEQLESAAAATDDAMAADGRKPAMQLPQQAAAPDGPVALGSSAELSINLASREYAASVPAVDDGRIAFVSYAGSPDISEWNRLASYMQLCGLQGFGYASGFNVGKAPLDFPFSAAASRDGRERMELGLFNPARYLAELGNGQSYYIPVRSSDLAAMEQASLFDGNANGYREFMLIRQFSAGMSSSAAPAGLQLGDDMQAVLFTSGDRNVLMVASQRPGISLSLPQQFQGWQQVLVDPQGRLTSKQAGGSVQEDGRLLVLVLDGGE